MSCAASGARSRRFDRVLVETTGLADPAPIAQLLLNNPLVSHSLRLDAIVATVDAVHAEGQLDVHPEAVKQAAIADRLVLTKTDLADAAAVAALRRRLTALNPAAPLETAVAGEIDPGRLFGAGLFDPERKTPDVRRWLNEAAYEWRITGTRTTSTATTAGSAPSASPSTRRSTGRRSRSGSAGCGASAAPTCCE